MRTYLMANNILQKLLSQFQTKEIKCYRCDKPILIGQKVRASARSHANHIRLYHCECYEEMLIV